MNSTDPPRNILITGAAGGLGSALAAACADMGARPLLVDRDLRGLEAACERVEKAGGPGPGYCELDLARAGPGEYQELLAGFEQAYGALDALVHAAAHFEALRPMEHVAGDEWLKTMQVNCNAAWLLSASALPGLRRRQGSALVFMLDGQAVAGSAYWGAYGVSKAAVEAMALTLATELEGTPCRVYGIDPGPMRTALRARAYMAEDPSSQPTPDHAARFIAELLVNKTAARDVLLRVPEA